MAVPASQLPALVRLADARAAPLEPGRLSALVLAHGTMQLRWYEPPGEDRQSPHRQDEIYIVARGSGTFVRAGERFAFEPGDALFVAAGVDHHFEGFTEGFAVWVVFWGPDGGESG